MFNLFEKTFCTVNKKLALEEEQGLPRLDKALLVGDALRRAGLQPGSPRRPQHPRAPETVSPGRREKPIEVDRENMPQAVRHVLLVQRDAFGLLLTQAHQDLLDGVLVHQVVEDDGFRHLQQVHQRGEPALHPLDPVALRQKPGHTDLGLEGGAEVELLEDLAEDFGVLEAGANVGLEAGAQLSLHHPTHFLPFSGRALSQKNPQ